jgi:hypothetical protein
MLAQRAGRFRTGAYGAAGLAPGLDIRLDLMLQMKPQLVFELTADLATSSEPS